jgi:outer membrane protein OmpA-like peptidoglycan-associated protein
MMKIISFSFCLLIMLSISTSVAAQRKECPCDYPTIHFSGNSLVLNADAKAFLAMVASKMKTNPDCSINIQSSPQEKSSLEYQLCLKRLKVVKEYLTEKEGISSDRIEEYCIADLVGRGIVDIKCN